MRHKIKVYVDGKRKFSWFGFVWRYDQTKGIVVFRKPLKYESYVVVTYDVHLNKRNWGN